MSTLATKQEGPLPKKQRIGDRKSIGTHNGTFHCDEALAVYLLKNTTSYGNADVVRTRNPQLLDECDIVVDVGAEYDDAKRRYDHHQRGFTEVLGHGFSTKLSSAGLIYKHYGKEIIAAQLQLLDGDPRTETLWLKLYKEFIESIDAIDNGIPQYGDAKPLYRNRTDLSSRVGHLNAAWNEPVDAAGVDTLFAKASALAGEEFFSRLRYYANAWLPAQEIVTAAVQSRTTVDASGQIILFEQFAPWKEHLFDIEQELDIKGDKAPIYVIYADETAKSWRVQAVPVSPDSFESRKPLPSAWRGVRDEALSALTGIPGCIFVHAAGFIGGNNTMEGALTMARMGLSEKS